MAHRAGILGAHPHPHQCRIKYASFHLCFVLAAIFFLSPATCPVSGAKAAAPPSFTLFESGQVRPLAIAPDGRRLFAVNTPDNRLEIFLIGEFGLTHEGSVPVGLEPVAVAARSNAEVWVVNHLSDSVSIVDLRYPHLRRVVRTLLVGDEPRDIVFAGKDRKRAFITTAHRGQNTGRDPELTTPGVGRADVWVFDANNLGNSLGGEPLTVLTLFTDTPRALAATPDGSLVYAAGFQTGNRTTTLNEFVVRQAVAESPRVYPGPTTNYAGILQPTVGLIVKHNGQHWVDELGQQWDDLVRFSLPDKDVFTIDAMTDPPSLVEGGDYSGVGTILFNMVVNPVSTAVYVSNTDAQNHLRFEGAGNFLGHPSVRGHLHESRITVLKAGSVVPRHLNKHIDYNQCCAAIPNDENRRSVASPMDMAITPDGRTLYVAAFGTSKIAIYDTQQLEDDSFVPDTAMQIPVTGGGPSGVVLDVAHDRLYVLTRFDNSISIVDLATRREIDHIPMYNPEPSHIVAGRRFLYDASFSSSHGDASCASCHVFGDFDSLAWDLGDPDASETQNTGPFRIDGTVGFFLGRNQLENVNFRPMKGPMTTQSLRGLANHGSMHWRGDRTGGNKEILNEDTGSNQQPNGGSFNEDLAFRKFNATFVAVNGRKDFIPDADMRKFAAFILELTYPPNPIASLENSLTAAQMRGEAIYFDKVSDTFFSCNGCHVLDRDGNREYSEVTKPGFFGTDGQFSFEGESQFFKVPHLRNLYQKVGMFGMAPRPETSEEVAPRGSALFEPFSSNAPMGPQVRGFGFLHDGSVDTVFRFLSNTLFNARSPGSLSGIDPGNVGLPRLENGVPTEEGVRQRRDLEEFLLAFDSNMAPIVGQQVTLTRSNAQTAGPRIDLLLARADAHECDLVAWNVVGGYLYEGNGRFRFADHRFPPVPERTLRISARVPFGEVTYTCVPPGSGNRIGLDRDENGVFDNEEFGH